MYYDISRLLREKCELCGKMRCYDCLCEYEQEEATRRVLSFFQDLKEAERIGRNRGIK